MKNGYFEDYCRNVLLLNINHHQPSFLGYNPFCLLLILKILLNVENTGCCPLADTSVEGFVLRLNITMDVHKVI